MILRNRVNFRGTGASIPGCSIRCYGVLSLIGLGTFILSLLALHLLSTGIDWSGAYVSNLANEPHGWIFGFGTFVHGWGNLALALGLGSALRPGLLRNLAVFLFSLAALGILLAALFPIDLPGRTMSAIGLIHRTAASAAFVLELAAIFLFTLVFSLSHCRYWHQQKSISLLLAVAASLALTWFVIAGQIGLMPGLAERVVLAIFMCWELWFIFNLIRPSPPEG